MISNLQRYPIRNEFGEYLALLLKKEYGHSFRGRIDRVGGVFRLAPLTPQFQVCRSAPGGS